ncbi:hypothetical protein GN244_ATG05172 [Phytophthora infestans]|uniref:Uncharacterized protein n=1 Tax=Phytophthora infestans TaxID=4787 RepID=A0A833TG30_PHYIN|nr:hypothetical protein GN244_ATG17784 [Phytophthora infestans]KAF4042464.1 hypothetical protein GN244_ATG05172 [Phytophthora infestans]KAF4150546.1 hypothetical protein GN958_ATG00208 [Phytophthora infestans]
MYWEQAVDELPDPQIPGRVTRGSVQTPSSGYIFEICAATKDGRPGLMIPHPNFACASKRLSGITNNAPAPNTLAMS